jgi:hypothetical protein
LGYFLNLSWKFPEVTRKLPHFRKFPEVKRDISRKVGNFQRSNGIFPGELEISKRLKKTHLINLHHCSQNQASLLLLGMLR